jgi:endo-1,4-beta-mannosidase
VQLAKRFKGQPALAAYDLINEPDRMDRKVLNDFYDRLYKEIRKVDPEHIMVIEAPWDFTILDTPAERGWTNVVYSMHVYDIAHWSAIFITGTLVPLT